MAYRNGGIYLCDHKLVRYRQHADNVVSAICGGGKREGEELGLSYFVGKAEDIYLLLHRRKQIKYSQKDWWRDNILNIELLNNKFHKQWIVWIC